MSKSKKNKVIAALAFGMSLGVVPSMIGMNVVVISDAKKKSLRAQELRVLQDLIWSEQASIFDIAEAEEMVSELLDPVGELSLDRVYHDPCVIAAMWLMVALIDKASQHHLVQKEPDSIVLARNILLQLKNLICLEWVVIPPRHFTILYHSIESVLSGDSKKIVLDKNYGSFCLRCGTPYRI